LKRKLLPQASTSKETELAEIQKKAEYDKQYRVKRKMQMQQQASTYSETESVPSRLRHINDSELSSLKMEGIRFRFMSTVGPHGQEWQR
jgi:hypothetical protein